MIPLFLRQPLMLRIRFNIPTIKVASTKLSVIISTSYGPTALDSFEPVFPSECVSELQSKQLRA